MLWRRQSVPSTAAIQLQLGLEDAETALGQPRAVRDAVSRPAQGEKRRNPVFLHLTFKTYLALTSFVEAVQRRCSST